MNPSQIPLLLKQVSYADPRVLPDDEEELKGLTALWATVLADVPADYAMNAVGRHYAESPFPIKPSDIADRWRTTVRERMRQHTGTFEPHEHPEVDPDAATGDDFVAALKAERHAVVQGHRAPMPARAITAAVTTDDVKAMRQQRDLANYVKEVGRERAAECERRRALVNRYPDLADRLQKIPGQRQWKGFIAPAEFGGKINNDPIRAQLIALVEEAEQRANGSKGEAA